MTDRSKKILKYAIWALVGLAMLFFAFRNVDWTEFSANLKQCNYWWIIALFFVCWLISWLRGCRWRLLMLPFDPKVTRLEAYDGYSICYLSNIALPRSGEVVRCGVIAGKGRCTFEQVLGSVALERSWDILCTILITVPLFFIGRFKDYMVEKIWGNFNTGKLLMLFGIIAGLVLLFIILRKYILRSKFLRGLVEGIKAGFQMEHKWKFFILTALIWLGHIMTSYMVILAFDQNPILSNMNFADALLLTTAGSLGWIVPVPGGFGSFHALVVATLTTFYGLGTDISLALAMLSHETQIVQMFLCGVISVIHLAIQKGIKERKKAKQTSTI